METTVQKESKRVKLLELKQVADDITRHFKSIAGVLSNVKLEYENLNVGAFTREIMLDFCKRGPAVVEEKINVVLRESFKDLPSNIFTLIMSPTEKIRAQFGKLYEQIKNSVPGWGFEFSQSSTLEQSRFTALTKDYSLLDINDKGEICLPDKSIVKIVDVTVFCAKTKVQLRLLTVGKEIESLIAEAEKLWVDSGLDKNTLISIPTDRYFEALFEIDNDNNFTFNTQAVRFIQ